MFLQIRNQAEEFLFNYCFDMQNGKIQMIGMI